MVTWKPVRHVGFCALVACSVTLGVFSAGASGSPASDAGAGVRARAADACSGLYSFGYVAKRHRISCRSAQRVASKANRTGIGPGGGADCGPSRVWQMGVWRIRGPIDGWLTYRFSRANGQRFTTSKPTDYI